MMLRAPLLLSMGMLVAGPLACGRTDPDSGLAESPGDASSLDAAHDASLRHAEASVTDASSGADQTALADSYVAADEGAAPDSALDATEAPEASTDGSAEAGTDANADAFASDAAGTPLSCDQCTRGDQQCGGPIVCATSDAGVILSCAPTEFFTCISGDAGCAVWGQVVACRPDVPCCVPCKHLYACPLGNLGDPCQQDADCAFNACDALTHECITSQCGDHHQDGDESDVDCGGQICNACLTGQRCVNSFDCEAGHPCSASHVCT
jgi:hypothetical protein